MRAFHKKRIRRTTFGVTLVKSPRFERIHVVIYFLAGCLLSAIFFIWGALTVHKQVWPHSLLKYYRGESSSGEHSLHRRQRQSLFDSFTRNKDLVFFGDSITEQAPWVEMFPGVSLANRGVSGERLTDMVTRFDDVIALRPKAVFLMGGVNDAADDDVTSAVSSISTIVEALQDEGIDVYLQTTIEPRGPRRVFVKRLNIEIKKLAEVRGLVLIDTATLADDGGLRSEYTLDGVHLNGDGFKAWHRLLEPHVQAALHNTAQGATQ